jgi:nitroimidazol reductase NimA-like FMN-containing flavoprotein (pyridoxamine 5'-phosphate oxidase superfamily)
MAIDLIARARTTLSNIANASLATVGADGHPWNTPVFVAFDEELTFYWSSQWRSVHSQNIAHHPQVTLVVFDSRADDDSGHAVYVAATARELTDAAEIGTALERLAKRRGKPPKPAEDFTGTHPRRVYAAVPHTLWTNVVHERDGHVFDERVVIDRGDLAVNV